MANDKTYNGWSNYETWAVALWLDNEEPSYREVRRLAAEAREEFEDDDAADDRIAHLANCISGMVEEMQPDLGPSVFSDLLNAALSEVDYHEIAKSVLEEK